VPYGDGRQLQCRVKNRSSKRPPVYIHLRSDVWDGQQDPISDRRVRPVRLGLKFTSRSRGMVGNNFTGPIYWSCRYDFPAVIDRYVSFDGVTEVLHQHFSYVTNWTGTNPTWNYKTTTQTTYDLVRNTNFVTIYTYSPLAIAYVPNCASCSGTNQIPVEQTIDSQSPPGTVNNHDHREQESR